MKINEPEREKISNLGSDQVRHKPDCTVTEDGYRLDILDSESRGIDLRLCFRLCRLLVFSCGGSYTKYII